MCLEGFNSNVYYVPGERDHSHTLANWAEVGANFCRKPGDWLMTVCWNGPRDVTVPSIFQSVNEPEEKIPLNCIMKTIYLVAGVILFIPGEIIGSALKVVSFALSSEIRLKHKWAVKSLSEEDKKTLKSIVTARVTAQNQEFESVPCICSVALSMLCMMCFIACK